MQDNISEAKLKDAVNKVSRAFDKATDVSMNTNVTSRELQKYISQLYIKKDAVHDGIVDNIGDVAKSYSKFKKDLDNYEIFFEKGGVFKKTNKGFIYILMDLFNKYYKAFKYFKPKGVINPANFQNIKPFVTLSNSYDDMIKLNSIFMNFLIDNKENPQNVENFIKFNLRYIKLFKKVEARTVAGIKETNLDVVSDTVKTLLYALSKMPDGKKYLNPQKILTLPGFNKAAYQNFETNLNELNSIIKEREDDLSGKENTETKDEKQNDSKTSKFTTKDKKNIKSGGFGNKSYKEMVKDTKEKLTQKQDSEINYKESIKKFVKVLKDMGLPDDKINMAVMKFVTENKELIFGKGFITEALPQIRWRKNPRLGLNKIVLVCKSSEYKKSLNRDITISGKKVKDVMCLPKSAKPASQRMKDRKASLKRWKTLRSKPAQMRKIKFKKKETRRQSKTIRKET